MLHIVAALISQQNVTLAVIHTTQYVLTFRGTCFLVCIQDITIPALAVIRGIAVDTCVFAVMSHGTGLRTWNKPGLRDGAVKMAAWVQFNAVCYW